MSYPESATMGIHISREYGREDNVKARHMEKQPQTSSVGSYRRQNNQEAGLCSFLQLS